MHPSPSTRHAIAPPATTERTVFVVAGAFLLLPVLRRRSLWRCVAATAGGALIYNALCGKRSVMQHLLTPQPVALRNVGRSITIGRSAVDLSAMWRTPDVLARVMQPFGQIEILGTDQIRWTLQLKSKTIAVDCALVEETPGELVHWKSIQGAEYSVDERMYFKPAPQGRGTEATLTYDIDLSIVPAGAMLNSMTSFFEGAATLALSKVLHNFKSLAETGEIATLERNPSARANGTSTGDLI